MDALPSGRDMTLPCRYLAHHVPESVNDVVVIIMTIIIIIIIIVVIVIIIIIVIIVTFVTIIFNVIVDTLQQTGS